MQRTWPCPSTRSRGTNQHPSAESSGRPMLAPNPVLAIWARLYTMTSTHALKWFKQDHGPPDAKQPTGSHRSAMRTWSTRRRCALPPLQVTPPARSKKTASPGSWLNHSGLQHHGKPAPGPPKFSLKAMQRVQLRRSSLTASPPNRVPSYMPRFLMVVPCTLANVNILVRGRCSNTTYTQHTHHTHLAYFLY